MAEPGYLDGYMSGQWAAAEQLMNLINAFMGPLRRTDMYRMLMDYRPTLPAVSFKAPVDGTNEQEPGA